MSQNKNKLSNNQLNQLQSLDQLIHYVDNGVKENVLNAHQEPISAMDNVFNQIHYVLHSIKKMVIA